MTAQLFLPRGLVDEMVATDNLDAFAHAEELTAYQAMSNALGTGTPYRGEAQWIEHDGGMWEVRVD